MVTKSAIGDLASVGGDGNCFAGNTFTHVASRRTSSRCCRAPGTGIPATDALDIQQYLDAKKPPSIDYRKAKTPPPPKLPGMKNPKTAKAQPGEPHRGERGPRDGPDAGAAGPPALTA